MPEVTRMIKFLLQKKALIKITFWLWLLFVAIVSSLPNLPTQKINIWDEPFRLDYLEHFGVFFILSGLFVFWKADKESIFHIENQLIFVLALTLYAIVDELHQLWIPGRSYNPLDLTYNLLGCFAGIYITNRILRKMVSKWHEKNDSL